MVVRAPTRSLFVNMATGYTKEWIRFFTGCGIPDDVATMYALIFYENRIQKNMLPDLNKEYLRDMGITVMGDVIAILRYAKIVHEKLVREQILSVEDNILEENNVTNDSSPSIKKSTPMKRMLEHYTRKYNNSDVESINEVQVVVSNDKVSPTVIQNAGKPSTLKKKIEISVKPTILKEKGLEVPVPKVRRVLPENEGGYKIKMPSGTTERSKKLLEQAKKRKTKTVFDRLGESSVSSTTSETSVAPSSTTNSSLKNSSVFSRLGEKTSAVSSTSSTDDVDKILPDQLPYAGILKGNSHKKGIPKASMRADEQQNSEIGKHHLKKGISVKKRLGITKPNSDDEIINRSLGNKTTTLSKEGVSKKNTITKLPNRLNSTNSGLKLNNRIDNLNKKLNNYRVESTQGKSTVSTTQIQERDLKRKLDNQTVPDTNPSKKVRFGKTTHRLIPSTPSPTDPVSYVKNYPKLTMIICNSKPNSEKVKFPSGIKTGSLNSDNIKQRIGIKDRIGNKSLQGRLGERISTGGPPKKKISRVQDRLG